MNAFEEYQHLFNEENPFGKFVTDEHACKDSCRHTPGCGGFTYYSPVFGDIRSGRCYLKRMQNRYQYNAGTSVANAISGSLRCNQGKADF